MEKGGKVDDSFITNADGQACSTKELSALMKTACKAVGVPELKCQLWRRVVESRAKEQQLQACLQSPEASYSQFQLGCVSQHQDHSEETAEAKYGMNTSNRKEIYGKFVSSIVESRKRKAKSNIGKSPKRMKHSSPVRCDSGTKSQSEMLERVRMYLLSHGAR